MATFGWGLNSVEVLQRAREDYVSDLANSIGVTTNHRRQRQIAPASGAPVYRRFRHGLRLRAADPRPRYAWVGGATAGSPHDTHDTLQHTLRSGQHHSRALSTGKSSLVCPPRPGWALKIPCPRASSSRRPASPPSANRSAPPYPWLRKRKQKSHAT